MSTTHLSAAALTAALSLRDLSDPVAGPHAMQQLVSAITAALHRLWGCPVQVHRTLPLVRVADNYDGLNYPSDGPARAARYSRYVTDDTLLRTHTSAAIPSLLRAISPTPPEDLLLAVPGLVYRRDAIDRMHTGEPHQLDLWRICAHPCTGAYLLAMIGAVIEAALPGHRWRTEPRCHPYTRDGLQIDVYSGGDWIEVGECGLADPTVLSRCGLGSHGGLAMGLGLDRLLMVRKSIPDIRLLRHPDPRIARQMLHLDPYRTVSRHPPMRRDISIAVDTDDGELLGDRVREVLGADAVCVEAVVVRAATSGADLPEVARERLGLRDGQRNVLLRLTLRRPDRTMTAEEANRLRDRLLLALHQGDVAQC